MSDNDIDQLPTKRPISIGLEEKLFEVLPVLDHGFVRVMDYMGNDASIVQAARVSYGRGTKTSLEDRGLIRYLMRHQHTTPFEMCELKLHVKLPIFVARQWIRHRTASVNEMSARYSILDKEFYLPEPSVIGVQSKKNKQGREEVVTPEEAAAILDLLKADAEGNYASYEQLLNDNGDGTPQDEGRPQLARELARMDLTLNYYTQWYWKVDLHNLFNFLALRMDGHAQYEIRQYADVIGELVAGWVPDAWSAFVDYRLKAAKFSALEMIVLRNLMATAAVAAFPKDESGKSSINRFLAEELKKYQLSAREIGEFLEKLGLK